MANENLRAAATGQVAGKEKTPYERFRDRMMQLRPDLMALLGSPDAVARFERVTLNAVQQNPKLLAADQRTLLLACMKAAQDRLLPDGREAVLNIYNTKITTPDGQDKWINAVQYLPMVRGVIKLLWDTGLFTMLDAVAVYQKDHFKYQRGDDPKIDHVPYDGEADPGELRAAYFIGKLTNGETKREVMFRRDIEKAHQQSQGYKSAVKYKSEEKGPWVDWYDQMAIKSVIHRVWKQLPDMPERIEKTVVADMQAGAQMTSALDPLEGGTLSLPEHAGGTPYPEGQTIKGESERVPAERDQGAAGKNGSEAQAAAQTQRGPDPAEGGPGASESLVTIIDVIAKFNSISDLDALSEYASSPDIPDAIRNGDRFSGEFKKRTDAIKEEAHAKERKKKAAVVGKNMSME